MTANETRHRAKLTKTLTPVPLVMGSESRLAQVFINILVNAAQAIEEGAADRNEIRVLTKVADRERVVIEFHDTGCGMAPDVVKRIFDPFFTTKPIGIGMGLGLSICHGIITSLGGEIKVESAEGQGSVFRVFLRTAAPRRAEAPPPSARPAAASAHRRGRILVIDDEAALLDALRRALGTEHEVVCSSNGREALAKIVAGERYDVILCDLSMPVMTGREMYDEIGKVAPEQAQAMMFMTGGAFTEGARAFLSELGRPCIEKPFDVLKLRALINASFA